VIAKETFTDSKKNGVSAEELKRANPFLKRKDCKLDRSSLSLQRLLPQESL
jgi:hypothetical protein